MKQQQDKYDILKTYYGYDTFRDGQEELIDCLLNGQAPGNPSAIRFQPCCCLMLPSWSPP